MRYSFRFKLFNRFTLAALLASLIASAVQVTPVYAASITVNSNLDTDAVDGVCTLREALLAAQQNSAYHECSAGAGADVITFLENYTITLSSRLAVASTVTIQGKGAELTILQANTSPTAATYRVFEVAAQGNLTLENLTVRHGSCNGTCTSPAGTSPNGGAGIMNAGTLTINNSTISNNFAVSGAGIWNGGSLMVTNSIFLRNEATSGGGAIWNAGTLTVTGSIFSDNSAPNGGGLRTNGGSANLTNSTFSGNSATSKGGGIFNDQSATGTVTNSTFSGNSAPSGGGGIFNGAAITLRNTVVADSPSGGNCAGAITNGGGNLDSGSTCGWGSTGGSLSNTNPTLGPLADNGGPTKTHALSLGSPAIGKGLSGNCPSVDQRGVKRPQSSLCDMGAYETYSIVVNSSADTIADDGLCTLREAITAANTNTATGGCLAGSATGTDSIRISVNDPITLAGSQLPVVTSPIIITGAGPEKTIIQAAASPNVATDRIFGVESGGNLTLNQLTMRHGVCLSQCHGSGFGAAGGAIFNNGFLTIINSTFSDNSAESGGAIFNYRILTVVNSLFSRNQATGGGAIYSFYSTAESHLAITTVTNSTFSDNNVTGIGGGIRTLEETTVTNSTFSGNSAGNGGGGVSSHGRLYLQNTIVANNSGGNCEATFTTMIIDRGGNLSWPDSTCPGINADPKLGPLAKNGGPTQTMALLAGSAAIDAAEDVNCPDADQRGGARPQGSHCDIGAYEFGATIIVLPTFGDVSPSYWAWDFIERLFHAGITGGCVLSPLQYCPETTVTRAQMAIFLLRGIHGSSYNPPALGGSTGFNDVPITYWAAAWIKQLAAEGITGGCGSGSYCPEGAVTRAQMAIFLLRSKHGASYSPPAVGGSTGFTDVPASYWAAAWIKQLVAEGITSGCGSGTYCPESSVTRAQMAVFLVRTFNLP